ncbi:MAG: hypothetical protein LBS49_14365 [Candidatus Accumulibacter sp.]|nr:hypothetical protein [Accumulibacter sp.]
MTSSLENALKETWEKKEKFYEDTKNLTIMEIMEKIEGKKFNVETGTAHNRSVCASSAGREKVL